MFDIPWQRFVPESFLKFVRPFGVPINWFESVAETHYTSQDGASTISNNFILMGWLSHVLMMCVKFSEPFVIVLAFYSAWSQWDPFHLLLSVLFSLFSWLTWNLSRAIPVDGYMVSHLAVDKADLVPTRPSRNGWPILIISVSLICLFVSKLFYIDETSNPLYWFFGFVGFRFVRVTFFLLKAFNFHL